MQLHVHSQIAHVARTITDGKWRAPDSLGYNEHIGAVGAIVSQHLEEALTQRFGLEWTTRDDGHGFEIQGISGQMMRVFSSRRESINADLRERATQFEQRYGRAPSQRELAHLAQAANFKTRNAKTGTLDFTQLHAGWADKLAHKLGVSLASVAPSVWHSATGHAAAHAHDAAVDQAGEQGDTQVFSGWPALWNRSGGGLDSDDLAVGAQDQRPAREDYPPVERPVRTDRQSVRGRVCHRFLLCVREREVVTYAQGEALPGRLQQAAGQFVAGVLAASGRAAPRRAAARRHAPPSGTSGKQARLSRGSP